MLREQLVKQNVQLRSMLKGRLRTMRHAFSSRGYATPTMLSSAQRESFQRDGYLLIENLVDQVTVEELRCRWEPLFRGEFETGVTSLSWVDTNRAPQTLTSFTKKN